MKAGGRARQSAQCSASGASRWAQRGQRGASDASARSVSQPSHRRAGLDYHEWQPVRVHDTLQEALADTGAAASHIYALTTHAQRSVGDVRFEAGDVFVFGRESAGLSEEHHAMFAPQQRLRLPMRAGQRSLNLSNAVAVTVFEAWRQLGYEGGG